MFSPCKVCFPFSNFRRRGFVVSAALLFLFLRVVGTVCAQDFSTPFDDVGGAADVSSAGLTADSVRASVEGAIEYLRGRQTKAGDWAEYPGYEPGATALCALSLLSAGLDKDDPTVAKALAYLRGFSPADQNQTYPISLQTMVFCLADPTTDRARIEANVAWLIERQMKTANDYNGGWSYVGNRQESERADNSNSQFAILALYEAEQIGVAIPGKVWAAAEQYWFRMQNDDGSWGYRASSLNSPETPSGYGTGSMTCAGITALAMCSGVRGAARAKIDGDRALCCQDVDDETADRIDHGLRWMAKHFSVRTNPGRAAGSDAYLFYYLYGLERVGRLTANRFIGQSDWYREGADTLLRRKAELSYYWVAQKDLGKNNCISTAFALLFLSKGRWPTLVSKLKFGDDLNWNAHPNDWARLTRRIETRWGLNLVWQTIDVKKATLDDYLQTPILSISGNTSPIPDSPEAKKRLVQDLRGYLERGGFIFAEALDGDVSFETGFRELMAEILADDGGELTLLPPNHPIWTAEVKIPVARLRPLFGADFGCRTSVVFAPSMKPESQTPGEAPSVFDVRPSLSCLWEAAPPDYWSARKTDAAPGAEIASELEAAFALGQNICAYATNREMKFKEEIAADAASELDKNSDVHNSLFVGLLECGAGASCAPRAVPNLMRWIREKFGVPAQLHVPRTTAKTDDIFDYPTLFMHGRNGFSFSEEERERLRLYFERGGFLFANAVCASKKFEEAFLQEMAQIFPDDEIVEIPADDELFSGRYGGFKLDGLKYRRRNSDDAGQTLVDGPPELRGVRRDGRWIVVFSPNDVACALENVAAANCEGLAPESARRLATNIIFYAAEAF